MEPVICPNCGRATPQGRFCEHCGASLLAPPLQVPPPSPPVPPRKEGPVHSTPLIIIGVVVLIVILLACAGYLAASNNSHNATPLTPTPTLTPTAVKTLVTGVPATSQPATTSTTTTAQLSNGVTLSYPRDWQKQELSTTALRDYGRYTTNIANFYSPDISSERAAQAQSNIDKSSYTVLSIDVDPQPVDDFEQYFNLVTLSLQKTYGSITITKHNYQLKISPGDSFDGYNSYQLDFDTSKMRGSYIFTNVDGTIYIFAFRNPSPYSSEIQDMVRSIRINSGTPQKQR